MKDLAFDMNVMLEAPEACTPATQEAHQTSNDAKGATPGGKEEARIMPPTAAVYIPPRTTEATPRVMP
jgi:hypothetical protein